MIEWRVVVVSRDHTFAAALCVSLVAHAGMLLVLAGQVRQPATLAPLAVASRIEDHSQVYIPAPPTPPPADLLFGDKDGAGDGHNTRAGDEPMIGRDGNEVQAFLSRDPSGFGNVGDDPSMSVLPQGKSNPAPQPPANEPPAQAFGVTEAPAAMAMAAPHVDRHLPQASPAPSADPAVMSDSESDPFSKNNGQIEFRDGRVDVRFGRKIKTIRPRLSLAAQYDLLATRFPRMRVRLHVNPAGGIKRVDIVQSTGSESVDQAVKLALYQWWVEPLKDNSGTEIADVIEFPIVWR